MTKKGDAPTERITKANKLSEQIAEHEEQEKTQQQEDINETKSSSKAKKEQQAFIDPNEIQISKFIKPDEQDKDIVEETNFQEELAQFEDQYLKDQPTKDQDSTSQPSEQEILDQQKESKEKQTKHNDRDKNLKDNLTIHNLKSKHEDLINSLSEDNEDGLLFYKMDPGYKKTWWEKWRARYHQTKFYRILKEMSVKSKVIGFSFLISLIVIIIFSIYYISPLSFAKTVNVEGNYIVSQNDIIQASGVKAKTRFWDDYFHSKRLTNTIKKKYPSVKGAYITVSQFNHITIHIKEYDVAGLLKTTGGNYYPILDNGTILQMNLADNSQNRLLFTNFNSDKILKEVIGQYETIPDKIRKKVKEIKYSPTDSNDMRLKLYMKDGNIVIISGYKFANLKYYNQVVKQLDGKSEIDMEAGIFAKPMSGTTKNSAVQNNYWANQETKTSQSKQDIVIPEN